jgi:uncharacterized protein (TIGR00290 family)
MKEKAILFWSGGKDSALCLYKIMQEGHYEVVALVTTISADLKRVSMHGIREELIEEQAKRIQMKNGGQGIFLHKMYINSHSTNEVYEASLERILLNYKLEGIHKVIFGDIFLEDLRAYRETLLQKYGMHGVYPLWKLPTGELINQFIDLGFKTMICCCDNRLLDEHVLGKVIDEELVRSFPPEIDPCGENGEFHTFTFAGPLFSQEIKLIPGERVLKVYELESGMKQEHGFWFIDMQSEL